MSLPLNQQTPTMWNGSGQNDNTEGSKVQQGYEAVFDPELDKKYACPVCLAALRDPVQTKCGHRFCRSCLDHSRGKSRYGRCPVDNTWFDPKRHVFEDNATRREVLSLSIKCDNESEGCPWKSELRARDKHIQSCAHGCMGCPNDCFHRCKRKDMDGHLKECPKRLQNCQECGKDVQASELAKHQLLVCEKFPVTCTMCGENGLLRDQIARHLDQIQGDCPLVIVNCQFSQLGCFFQDKRKNMETHYRTANLHHMQLVSIKLQQQEDFLTLQQRQMTDVTEKCNQLSLHTENLQRMIEEQGEVIQVQASCINELESLCSYEGRLLWRLPIPMNDMETIVSPAFYTGRPGFKITMSLKTAQIQNEGSFSMLQLNIQKGQFDSLLEFPFEGTCQATIFDQAGGRNNFKSAFDFCLDAEGRVGAREGSSSSQPELAQAKLMKREKLFACPYKKDNALLLLIHVNGNNSNTVLFSSTL